MQDILIGLLVFIVAVLTVLQGWQMKRKNNPNSFGPKLDKVVSKLDTISSHLGRMDQRLNDIWDKVKRE